MLGSLISGSSNLAGSLGSNLMGGVGDYYAKERALDAINAQKEGQRQANEIGSQYYNQQISERNPEAMTYMSDLGKWRDVSSQQLPQYQQFDQSGYGVDKYLDPSMQYTQDQSRRQIEQSQLGRTGLNSGATAKALQDRATQLAMTDFGNASQRAMQDKQFGYSDWIKKFDSDRSNAVDYRSSLGNIVDQSGRARDNVSQLRSGLADTGINNATTMAGLEANRHNTIGSYLSGQFNRGGKAIQDIGSKGGQMLGQAFGTPTAQT